MSIKSNLRYQYINKTHISNFFEHDPADHEMLLYDPNYMEVENLFGPEKG